MIIKILIAKVALNSEKLFALRKNPSEVKNLVYNSIKKPSESIYKSKELSYAMEIIEEFKKEPTSILYGRMVGYKHDNKLEHFDENEMKVSVKNSYNDIRNKAYFMYDKTSQYIFFEEKSHLNKKTFMHALEYIINKNNLDIDVLVNPILDKEKAKQSLKILHRITRACFEVIPDNPGNRLNDKMDELIEIFKATTAKYEFSNKNGLNNSEEMEQLVDDIIEGKKKRYVLYGYDKLGNPNQFDSNDDNNLKRIIKEVANDDVGRKGGLWAAVRETLNL